jgi:hypothetical protein
VSADRSPQGPVGLGDSVQRWWADNDISVSEYPNRLDLTSRLGTDQGLTCMSFSTEDAPGADHALAAVRSRAFQVVTSPVSVIAPPF